MMRTIRFPPELLEWANLIFVMEKAHRSKLSAKFRKHLHAQRIVCLDIPDDYEFMDPALVALLKIKVTRHLPVPTQAEPTYPSTLPEQ
jgi:predicted protein tyrosine phosphatase